MLRPSPSHATLRLPNDEDDDTFFVILKYTYKFVYRKFEFSEMIFHIL